MMVPPVFLVVVEKVETKQMEVMEVLGMLMGVLDR